MIDFDVEVVNVGRRVARIEEVGIHIFGKVSPRDKHGVKIIVFSGNDDGVFSLQEGEKKVFELRRWPKTLQDMAEHFADEETVYPLNIRQSIQRHAKNPFDVQGASCA